jgi:hypothetical protein
MIDRRPELSSRANVADTRTMVNFARKEGLTVAVRGGGTMVPGWQFVITGL